MVVKNKAVFNGYVVVKNKAVFGGYVVVKISDSNFCRADAA